MPPKTELPLSHKTEWLPTDGTGTMTTQRDQAYDLGDPMFATDDFRCFRYKVCLGFAVGVVLVIRFFWRWDFSAGAQYGHCSYMTAEHCLLSFIWWGTAPYTPAVSLTGVLPYRLSCALGDGPMTGHSVLTLTHRKRLSEGTRSSSSIRELPAKRSGRCADALQHSAFACCMLPFCLVYTVMMFLA